MSSVPQRLAALRARMRDCGADACVVPTSDFNGSEYVSPCFRAREYLTGFTGSAGTLVVFADAAYLFTDGRYFLQAEAELCGSGVTLMRMGEPGVPALAMLLHDTLKDGATLCVDGRTVDAKTVQAWMRTLSDKDIRLLGDVDLPGEIWEDRPPLPDAPCWLLEERFAGESAADKLAWLRGEMRARAADVCVLANCTDIAWLFNLRGGDLPHTPVPLCFCFVEQDKFCLCLDESKRNAALTAALAALGGEFRPYAGVYGYADRYGQGTTVMLSAARVNYALFSQLCRDAIILDTPDVVALRKAVKNPVEIENLRQAHLRDGVALTRFMHWLKKSVGKRPISECSAARRLDDERLAQENCLGLSFDTICAYGPHGAIVHYAPNEESDAPLENAGLFVVDSGAQYYEGTTDVTRTYALGPTTAEERRHYTLVLKGMLDLMDFVFPAGLEGEHLDVIARAPLWAEGLDYNHGTGHGVGYLLGVHEDPVRIRRHRDDLVFAPGMVTSDEPGVYIAGEHGVRIENQLLCRADAHAGYLGFECLTLAPIDLEPVEAGLLSPGERESLNRYHARVRAALAPFFGGEMGLWLNEVTRAI